MNTYHGKTIEHWKNNAEEDYITTPISVLRYITELEKEVLKTNKKQTMKKIGPCCFGAVVDIS